MRHSRLYSLIWYDASDAAQVRRAELCAAEILQRSTAIDVTHGIDSTGDIGGKVTEASIERKVDAAPQ